MKSFKLQGIAHITGGGIPENVPRVIGKGLCAVIEKTKINVPPIFSLLQKLGNVPEKEMWLTFNMGIGLVLVVRAKEEGPVLESLAAQGYTAASIGSIKPRQSRENGVLLV